MARSLLSIVVGYFTIAGFNALVRVIVWFYFRNDFSLNGIESLPSDFWVYTITAIQIMLGILGGLMVSSIVGKDAHIEILSFILLIVAMGLIDYSVLNESEPLWYLITSPLLRASGIFLGYRLKVRQDKQLNQSIR